LVIAVTGLKRRKLFGRFVFSMSTFWQLRATRFFRPIFGNIWIPPREIGLEKPVFFADQWDNIHGILYFWRSQKRVWDTKLGDQLSDLPLRFDNEFAYEHVYSKSIQSLA
jgi:hypothetical protein